MKNLVVLISGRGSNMMAIAQNLPKDARISLVLSNDPNAKGLEWARGQGLKTAAISHKDFPNRESFDAAMMEIIDAESPDLVVLAGFMRVLGENFCRRYEGRLLNIHPSLLPSFTGLHTHKRAIEAGVKVHGCTVHFVIPELDMGPVIIQAAVPVLRDDDEDTLAARVLAKEHVIYPKACELVLSGKTRLMDGKVVTDVPLDGDPASMGFISY